jgi:hypothetical protein
MPKSRDRRPSDFQFPSNDGRDEYLERVRRSAPEQNARILFARVLRPALEKSAKFALWVLPIFFLALFAYGGFVVSKVFNKTEYVWGSNGSPRDDDGTAWAAKCPENSRPVSGTCEIMKADGPIASKPDVPAASLKSFGVDQENQWRCSWTQRIAAANVRALCIK